MARPRRPLNRLAMDPASNAVIHKTPDLDAHVREVLQRLRNDDLPNQIWTVAFCNRRPVESDDGYGGTAEAMDRLAADQPGFVGVDSARSDDGVGITVSRWSSIAAMISWRRVVAHNEAQQHGRNGWYSWYRSDVARVDRSSEFTAEPSHGG